MGLGDSFVSQNPCKFYVSFSKTGSGLCIYHFSRMAKFQFLV